MDTVSPWSLSLGLLAGWLALRWLGLNAYTKSHRKQPANELNLRQKRLQQHLNMPAERRHMIGRSS